VTLGLEQQVAADTSTPPLERRPLSGWGRTAPSMGVVAAPESCDAIAELFLGSADGKPAGVIPRGLGRSYGDAAQSAGGVVIDTSRFDSIGPIDADTGLVDVGGGTSLDALIRAAIPSGWFIPVSPGTRQVTIGGAIAADVHGKNHHRDGSFCSFVSSLTLVTPVGVCTVTPESDPELFWATAGGMGLTGVIVQATLRLIRVETAWMEVDTQRFDDLDGTMSALTEMDHAYRFSVAWVDCSFRRRGRGRSIVSRGDHAPLSALSPKERSRALVLPASSRARVPFSLPGGLTAPSIWRTFNEMWFRKAPRSRVGELIPFSPFLHPLDGIGDWNLLFGRRGFVQYQYVVGDAASDVVGETLAMMAAARITASMAVLKRFGPGDPGPLSFPIPGWTLALDFPVGPSELPSLLDRLDELVAGVGGRVYLAKDARLRPELIPVMYPRVGELAEVRRRVDPRGVLRSDLSRRLGIDQWGERR
jgi:decaprenylphospho-beta-D-ribofuranose 2-oxidase